MNDIKPLQTTVDVIEALGGDDAIKAMTDCSPQTLWNWKNYGQFPSKTFVMMTAALAMKGKVAPARLWGMQTAAIAAE
jgi:hypothetical protein